MKIIKEHIKQNKYSSVYLIYGTENFLKNLYQNKLKTAVLGSGDEMNASHFEGRGIVEQKIIGIADTLPFFSDRRVIVIENSGFFKSQNSLADYLPSQPDSTVIIFVEAEVDKRSRLFKKVKELGTISEMNGLAEKDLKLWITTVLKRDQKKMTVNTIEYMISRVGSDMDNLSCELEKLICYAMDQEIITTDDIDRVCTVQIIGKIFQMVDAIGSKKQDTALALYYDLLTLKERPMTILYLICRQFNVLLQVKDLQRLGYNNTVISQKVGIPPFTVNKYLTQGKNFTAPTLKEALFFGTDVEESVKTGRLNEKIGVELLIVKYSR